MLALASHPATPFDTARQHHESCPNRSYLTGRSVMMAAHCGITPTAGRHARTFGKQPWHAA